MKDSCEMQETGKKQKENATGRNEFHGTRKGHNGVIT